MTSDNKVTDTQESSGSGEATSDPTNTDKVDLWNTVWILLSSDVNKEHMTDAVLAVFRTQVEQAQTELRKHYQTEITWLRENTGIEDKGRYRAFGYEDAANVAMRALDELFGEEK